MLPDPEGLLYPKQHTLFAARAAGILPFGFIGSIADFRDQDAFRAIVRRSKRFGFVGASAIHPLQVPVLNEEFSPSDAEVERAERMVAAYDAAFAQGLGAVQFEGAMIDVPVVQRAKNVIARATAIRAGRGNRVTGGARFCGIPRTKRRTVAASRAHEGKPITMTTKEDLPPPPEPPADEPYQAPAPAVRPTPARHGIALAAAALVITLTAPFWEDGALATLGIRTPLGRTAQQNALAVMRQDRRTEDISQRLATATTQLAKQQTEFTVAMQRADAAAALIRTLSLVRLSDTLRRPMPFAAELATVRVEGTDLGDLKPLLDKIEPYARHRHPRHDAASAGVSYAARSGVPRRFSVVDDEPGGLGTSARHIADARGRRPVARPAAIGVGAACGCRYRRCTGRYASVERRVSAGILQLERRRTGARCRG